jgi:hypothetical protein
MNSSWVLLSMQRVWRRGREVKIVVRKEASDRRIGESGGGGDEGRFDLELEANISDGTVMGKAASDEERSVRVIVRAMRSSNV